MSSTALALQDKEIELVNYETREQWLAARVNGIGASESSALFDLSPWDSIVSLWAKKAGLIVAPPLEGEWLEWGTLLEPALSQRYAMKTGREIWRAGEYCVAIHQRLPFMRATPDFWVINAPGMPGRGGLQIKNASFFKAKDWENEDGEIEPPPYVQVQIQHEMACTGLQWTSVVVLIGGNQFYTCDIMRNDAFIAEIEAQCEWLWDFIQRKERPPIDGSVWTNETLKKLHPADNGQTIELPEEAALWLARWQESKELAKTAKEKAVEADNHIRALLGDNTFGKLPDGRTLSLKSQNGGGYTSVVDPYTCRVLRLVAEKKQKKAKGK